MPVDLNEYVYLDEYAAEYIGHCFLKQGEDGMTAVTLVDVEVSTEETSAYSPPKNHALKLHLRLFRLRMKVV